MMTMFDEEKVFNRFSLTTIVVHCSNSSELKIENSFTESLTVDATLSSRVPGVITP